tara:strand:+ start:11554 stop:11775 length:222 start_codon:yes stop_codon:yes gene_type:complete
MKKKPAGRQLRPQARPERTQLRPQARPVDLTPRAEAGDQGFVRGKSPVQKKAAGGTVRGMGAAKKGGKFTRSA